MSTATGNFPLQCSSRRRRAPPPHGEVVAVHHADVVEVQSPRAVQGELRQCGRWDGASAAAFHGGGSTVSGDAGEFSGGVRGAQGPAPQAARPGGGDRDRVGLARLQGKAGGGELRRSGAG